MLAQASGPSEADDHMFATMRIVTLLMIAACAAGPLAAPAFAAECMTADGFRTPFTLDDQKAAQVPGIPDVRFFADDPDAFLKAMPKKPGPWLAVSGGGADGAYAAGVLNGWSTAPGGRPEFSVITGISTGAAIAPFVFLGKAYDEKLRENYTTINAGDIFEDLDTDQSLVDTWPLKDLIAKQVTPELLKAVAEQHRKGRRLYVGTMNLDSERRVIWDLGAIAAKGGEEGLALFRDVILASSSVPGLFPPVTIDLEANGKCVREVHIDGSVGGPFYIGPQDWLEGEANFKLPATELYVLLNAKSQPYFEMVQQNVLSLLARGISIALKFAGRIDTDRAQDAANKDGVKFHLAYITEDFNHPYQGAFDGVYMKALFDWGEAEAKAGKAFHDGLPVYAAR
jgi:hypothetical protein